MRLILLGAPGAGKGTPAMSASGLFGSRVEASRAGISAVKLTGPADPALPGRRCR